MLNLLASAGFEMWVGLLIVFLSFMFMWYKGKLPTTAEVQDLATVLNSRGGNILILAGASLFFFYRAERMYYTVAEMIKSGAIMSDNGIALNGLTFDTGAFGAAFGALLKTMSPEAGAPVSSTSSATTSVTSTVTKPATVSPTSNTNMTATLTREEINAIHSGNVTPPPQI